MIREDRLVQPSGCQYCGIPEREHFSRWTTAAGWHTWEQPTLVQRAERMRARREARTAKGNE